MKKLVLTITILAVGSMLIGCGAKSETKETKSPTVVSNTNPSMTNANATAARNDGDADDLKSSASNIMNTNKTKSTDADDVRSGNTASNANRADKRRDDDDRGKKDSDDDDR